jgi:acyl-CoA synthetase (AMP-forming)/AMP-acid ligase II
VGVPDPNRPENDLPFAFVVPHSKNLTENEILDFVADNVSDFKRLQGVIFVDKFETVLPTKSGLMSNRITWVK